MRFFFYWLTKGRGNSLFRLYSIGSKCSGHSPAAWTFDESGHAFDFMPKLCDEKHLDVPWPSHDPTLLGPSDNAGARQSTNFQPQTNNAIPGFGYGASKLYGDEIGASECVRPSSATMLNTNRLEKIAMRDCGEACTIPSVQESSQSFPPGPASLDAPEKHCTCIGCLKISWYGGQSRNSSEKFKCRFPGCLTSETSRRNLWYHETSHYKYYGTGGRYKCLEQDCRTVTVDFYELKRHYKKHCTIPDKEQFPCPVLWCKYSGNNGFLRKDKLKSHYKNIHEGKPGPFKAGRVLKPATLKPRVSSVGDGSSKQKE